MNFPFVLIKLRDTLAIVQVHYNQKLLNQVWQKILWAKATFQVEFMKLHKS